MVLPGDPCCGDVSNLSFPSLIINRIEKQILVSMQARPKQQGQEPRGALSNGFFEVTINSQKLAEMFAQIHQVLAQQNDKIEDLAKNVRAITVSVENKLEQESKRNAQLFTVLDLKITEKCNALQGGQDDRHRQSEAKVQEICQRVSDLASRLDTRQDRVKEEIQAGLAKMRVQIMGEEAEVRPQGQQAGEQAVEFPSLVREQEKSKGNVKAIVDRLKGQIQQVRNSIKPLVQELIEANNKQQESKHKDLDDMILKINRKDRVSYTLSAFNSKENVEKQKMASQPLLEKQLPTDNQGGSRLFKRGSYAKSRHYTCEPNGSRDSDVQKEKEDNQSKFTLLESMIKAEAENVRSLQNKELINGEKISIVARKLEKNQQEIAELKTIIRRVQSQKFDEKIIEELRNYTKWGLRDLEDKISKKCSQEDLQKQKAKLTQKISIVHENLIEKSDKSQVQKAIYFLENKIKQIIFLIAAEHSEQKNGAIVKTAFKCLSCDKDVQRQLQPENGLKKTTELSRPESGYMKSMSHRVKQKYRKEVVKTMTLGDQHKNQT